MITILDIISTLVNSDQKYTPIKEDVQDFINDADIIGNSINNVLDLLTIFNVSSDEIIFFLLNTNINKNINKRKILLNLRKNDIINNDIILFLSGYFEYNIWIHQLDYKTTRVYYLEEKLDESKLNIIIAYDKNGYRRIIYKNIYLFPYKNVFLQELINTYSVFPIGLNENKKFIKGDSYINPLFIDADPKNAFDIEIKYPKWLQNLNYKKINFDL